MKKSALSVHLEVIDEAPRLEEFFDALYPFLLRLDAEDQHRQAQPDSQQQPAA